MTAGSAARLTDRVLCIRAHPGSVASLVLIPHAGGNSYQYMDWVPPGHRPIGCYALDYPRSAAMDPGSEIITMAQILVADLLELPEPYIIVGHSLGAAIGFEMCRELDRRSRDVLLFVPSASPAASRRHERRIEVETMSDEHLADHLVRAGTLSAQVSHEPELLNLFLPIIRSDLTASGRYRCHPNVSIPVPMLALAGRNDRTVSTELVAEWEQHTTSEFDLMVLETSEHFYGSEAKAVALDTIGQWIDRRLAVRERNRTPVRDSLAGRVVGVHHHLDFEGQGDDQS